MAYVDAPEGWWQELLSAAPARTAKLGVVRRDGTPHVTPVWVVLDGHDVVFLTTRKVVAKVDVAG